jgi:hypothetical protein
MKNAIRTTLAAAAALVATQASSFAQQIYLNEIYASHSGTDLYEFIELKSAPARSLDNIVVIIVEGDWSSSGNEGTCDRVWDLTGYSTGATGHFVLGTDVDPDNDGITVIPTLGTILDSVGLVDGGINQVSPAFPDRIYDNAIQVGPEGVGTSAFLPAGCFRGLDAPSGWCPEFLDFNEAANALEPRTPGTQNSTCPSAVSVTNYCTPGTTTNGCTATMGYTGAPSLVLGPGGFTVNCTGIEGGKTGLIFYSISGPAALQWGTSSSFLCVKSPQQRSATITTGGTANACDGQISLDFFNYTTNVNPGALGVPFSAGNQAWFQCWFRDPPSPKTTMLSDGLDVTFAP